MWISACAALASAVAPVMAQPPAAQVGLRYDWEKSYAQTNPECRRFMYGVSIRNQPFPTAMAKILDPVGLRYRIESGAVVLYRK